MTGWIKGKGVAIKERTRESRLGGSMRREVEREEKITRKGKKRRRLQWTWRRGRD